MPRTSSSHHRSGVARQRVDPPATSSQSTTETATHKRAEAEDCSLWRYRRFLPEALALSIALLAFCASAFWRSEQMTMRTSKRARRGLQEGVRRPRAAGEEASRSTVSITSPGRPALDYVSFSIQDARAERSAAYFKSDPWAKLGIVFEAYSRLRNENDSRCFFYNGEKRSNSPLGLVMASQTVSEAGIANGSVLSAAAVADDSQVCGQGLKTLSKQFFLQNTTEFARLARLFLGCALADAAEPDWRRSTIVDDSPSSDSLQKARPPPKTLSRIERARKIEAENPWHKAESELREALRLGSRAARIALARLIVVSAHFETRPSFLDDARDVLAGDDQAFAEAVATGTRIAAKKASKLLANECASEEPDLDVIATALAAGADIDAAFEDDGSTSLMTAARLGHARVVSALLAAGADTNIVDDHDRTAAYFATDTATKEAFKAAGTELPQRRETDDDHDEGAEQRSSTTDVDAPHLSSRLRRRKTSPICDFVQRAAILLFVLLLAMRSFVLLSEICRRAFKGLPTLPPPRAAAAAVTRSIADSPVYRKLSRFLHRLSLSSCASLSRQPRQRTPPETPPVADDFPVVAGMTRRSKSVADDIETLDVTVLDVSTLERLDKLLPELQRSVVRELMAREAADSTRATQNSDECVICLAAPRLVAFGCGHLCCCENCADAVVECPVCRKRVSTRHRIFNTT